MFCPKLYIRPTHLTARDCEAQKRVQEWKTKNKGARLKQLGALFPLARPLVEQLQNLLVRGVHWAHIEANNEWAKAVCFGVYIPKREETPARRWLADSLVVHDSPPAPMLTSRARPRLCVAPNKAARCLFLSLTRLGGSSHFDDENKFTKMRV